MLMEEAIDVAFLADTEISPAFKDTSEVLRQEEVLLKSLETILMRSNILNPPLQLTLS